MFVNAVNHNLGQWIEFALLKKGLEIVCSFIMSSVHNEARDDVYDKHVY